jgi:general secretion pathway protein E
MAEASPIDLQARLDAVKPNNPERVSRLVELILEEAVRRSASDVHFEPTPRAVEIRFRLDGVLQSMANLNRDLAPNVVARLKVLAELLTYRMDIPQEGSILLRGSSPGSSGPGEGGMRVSTFPTIQGEKVVVRLFDPTGQVLELEELGLPGPLYAEMIGLLRERTGAVLLTGPSGSGKTTTIYACLRHLVRAEHRGRNIVTIEDPVEQVIEGVSQSQARPGTEFDFARGLRSLLRQDPEVIMIGEIRDRETAEIGIQAALTGHLVFSTLHTGSACGVINRLLDMQIEPYLLTSSLKAVLNQRLVRRLCEACHNPETGCEQCAGTGYRGRLLLAELLLIDDALREAILKRADTNTLEAIAQRADRSTLWTAVKEAVAAGLTTTSEIERVLGPRPGQGVPPVAR